MESIFENKTLTFCFGVILDLLVHFKEEILL